MPEIGGAASPLPPISGNFFAELRNFYLYWDKMSQIERDASLMTGRFLIGKMVDILFIGGISCETL